MSVSMKSKGFALQRRCCAPSPNQRMLLVFFSGGHRPGGRDGWECSTVTHTYLLILLVRRCAMRHRCGVDHIWRWTDMTGAEMAVRCNEDSWGLNGCKECTQIR